MVIQYRHIPSDIRYPGVVGPMTETEGNQLLTDFENWANDFTPSGVFKTPFKYILAMQSINGTIYYSLNSGYQTVYGGEDDAGGATGTSLSSVINTANASNYHGLIAATANLTGAPYEVDADITFGDYQGLVGESKYSTVFKAKAGTALTYMFKSGEPVPATVKYPQKFSDFTLDCAGATGGGLYLSSYEAVAHNIRVTDCSTVGLKVQDATGNAAGDCMISNIYAYNCDIGVDIEAADTYLNNIVAAHCTTAGILLTDNNIFGNILHAYGCGNGLEIQQAKFMHLSNIQLAENTTGLHRYGSYYSDLQIDNITFWENTSNHIFVEGVNGNNAGQMTLNNVNFVYESVRPTIAVRLDYPVELYSFKNVHCRGVPYSSAMWQLNYYQSGFKLDYSGDPTYRPNIYDKFVLTENWGLTACADGAAIRHGLHTTPTMVTVTGSIAGEIATSLASTWDGIDFNVDLKKHDGTAGTYQNVYWYATTKPVSLA